MRRPGPKFTLACLRPLQTHLSVALSGLPSPPGGVAPAGGVHGPARRALGRQHARSSRRAPWIPHAAQPHQRVVGASAHRQAAFPLQLRHAARGWRRSHRLPRAWLRSVGALFLLASPCRQPARRPPPPPPRPAAPLRRRLARHYRRSTPHGFPPSFATAQAAAARPPPGRSLRYR